MARPIGRKLPPRPKAPPTYSSVYDKVRDAKILTQKELMVLSGMKRNALLVNQKKIVKEVRIMPDKEEIKSIVKQVEKKKTPAELERQEYSDAAIDHIMEIYKNARYTPTTSEQIYNTGKTYFLTCEKNHITPTSSGLAMALGLRRKQLLAIASGEIRVQFQEAYQDLWQMLEVYDEAMMKQGKVNAIVGIFNQKNNHGWVDKVEVVHGNDKQESDEDIKKRYEEIIDIDENDK